MRSFLPRAGPDDRDTDKVLEEKTAREHIERYPAVATIPVRYDPQDPENAVLETGQLGVTGKILAGFIFAGIGIAAVVFSIWSASLPTRGQLDRRMLHAFACAPEVWSEAKTAGMHYASALFRYDSFSDTKGARFRLNPCLFEIRQKSDWVVAVIGIVAAGLFAKVRLTFLEGIGLWK